MIDTAQFRRSGEYSEFWVGQEDDIELQALALVAGTIAGRNLSGANWTLRLRFYDVPSNGGALTLIKTLDLDKIVDPDDGGSAGATGIGRKPLRFDEAHELVIAYFIGVDADAASPSTPSLKREVRLCLPWTLVVHDVPAIA